MEALVLIFAEIIFACLAPFFALIGALFGIVVEALALLLGGMFGEWAEARRARRRAAGKSAKPLIPRKALHWTAGVLGALGLAGILASFVMFQPILRHVLTTAADKAGMRVAYERASGMLLTGDVTLEGIKLARQDEGGLSFDLAVERARADVDVWSLLRRVPVIELARVEGVTGHVSPPRRDTDKPRKERRPFRVDLVQAAAVDIEIRPKQGQPYSLVIPQAEVAPFGSRSALFDLLFRSTMQAEVAGQPLSVQTREITAFGRETLWRFENVEAEKLKLIVPRAPLTWLSGGVLNVRVEDRWSLSEDWIEMNWQVGLVGVRAEAPDGVGTRQALLAKSLGTLLAAKGGDATFRYELSLTEDDIEGLRSGDLGQFWDVVLSGFLKDDANTDDTDRTDTAQRDSAPGEGAEKPGMIDRLKGLFGKDESRPAE